MSRPLRSLLTALVIAAASFLIVPGAASAQQPVPDLSITLLLGGDGDVDWSWPRAGEEIGAAVYLLDPAGNPITGKTIRLSVGNTFMNVTDQTEIDRGVTNDRGLALILFEPRVEGERLITASFDGGEVFAPVSASQPLTVLPGEQLHHEVSPFRIPGANVWMVTAILGTVWTLYLVAMLFGIHIAVSGDSA